MILGLLLLGLVGAEEAVELEVLSALEGGRGRSKEAIEPFGLNRVLLVAEGRLWSGMAGHLFSLGALQGAGCGLQGCGGKE